MQKNRSRRDARRRRDRKRRGILYGLYFRRLHKRVARAVKRADDSLERGDRCYSVSAATCTADQVVKCTAKVTVDGVEYTVETEDGFTVYTATYESRSEDKTLVDEGSAGQTTPGGLADRTCPICGEIHNKGLCQLYRKSRLLRAFAPKKPEAAVTPPVTAFSS